MGFYITVNCFTFCKIRPARFYYLLQNAVSIQINPGQAPHLHFHLFLCSISCLIFCRYRDHICALPVPVDLTKICFYRHFTISFIISCYVFFICCLPILIKYDIDIIPIIALLPNKSLDYRGFFILRPPSIRKGIRFHGIF